MEDLPEPRGERSLIHSKPARETERMDMGIGRIPEGLEQTGFGDWKPDVREREESRVSPFMACHGACKRPEKEEMVSQGEVSAGANTRVCEQDSGALSVYR